MVLNDFDPTNKTHVEWLKKLMEADIEKKIEVLQANPMNKDIPPFEVIHIIFGLAAKYTKAVFEKTAVII